MLVVSAIITPKELYLHLNELVFLSVVLMEQMPN